VDIPVYYDETEKNAVKISNDAVNSARLNARDTLIIDTAGRLAIDEQMMNEVSNIKEAVNPSEILL